MFSSRTQAFAWDALAGQSTTPQSQSIISQISRDIWLLKSYRFDAICVPGNSIATIIYVITEESFIELPTRGRHQQLRSGNQIPARLNSYLPRVRLHLGFNFSGILLRLLRPLLDSASFHNHSIVHIAFRNTQTYAHTQIPLCSSSNQQDMYFVESNPIHVLNNNSIHHHL